MFAARHHYRIDINQESVAQGMANVGAGLFQGMPVSTSLSASSLNDQSGARTGIASLTSGVVVLLTLLVLAPLFSDLPKPVLAALIIEAVVFGMIDLPEMRRLARVQRFDFWIAVAAIVATLLFGVLAGVMIGIGLSLIWLVSVATRPRMPLLAREPGTQVFRELDEHPEDEQFPGVVVLGLDGGLFFATSDALEDRFREVAMSTPGLTGIVLDCEGIDFIDSQGSAKMREILELTTQAGVTLRLARLKPAVRELLARDGVLERIGDDRIHGNVDHAVEAQLGGGLAEPGVTRRCRSGISVGERKERVMLRAVRRIGVLFVVTGTVALLTALPASAKGAAHSRAHHRLGVGPGPRGAGPAPMGRELPSSPSTADRRGTSSTATRS